MGHKILSIILMLALLSCEGCKKDDPKPLTELEKLPPATQTGKYTFGCLVNGKAWVTETTLDATAVYQQGILQITGHLYNPSRGIAFGIIEANGIIVKEKSYSLLAIPNITSYASLQKDASINCSYDENNTFNGTLSISKVDRINYIISGTFEFSTATEGCDTLRITNGRFDIKYIP